MVTVHSFTPVFNGVARSVEIGLLHGQDDRFARAMMAGLPENPPYDTRVNEPYAAKDGVVHTLDTHGAACGLLNVMIEVRNDLIATPDAQQSMGETLAKWIETALKRFPDGGGAS